VRILYLSPDLGVPVLGRKGASVHVRGLANALTRAGHRVVLAAPLLNKSPWEEPAGLAAQLLHLPLSAEATEIVLAVKAFEETVGAESSLPGELRRILYDQQSAVALKRRFEHHPPDFIYERASLYATAGVKLAGELGVPLLLELNAPLAEEQATYRATGLGDLAARAERWALTRADAVLAVSAPLRDYVTSLGVDPARAHVMPNGVDPSDFRPGPPDRSVRVQWGLGDGPVLGYVGGLRPWHGVGALPALLERLAGRFEGVRLVIAGDGPLRPELERAITSAGLTREAVFTGSIAHEQVPALIRSFDLALAPYDRFERPFYFSPLKLFEYMACGIPVVAADLGQIAEIVDGDSGLVYPAGDLDGLTAACERLLGDPALRRRQGEAAADKVRGRHTWDHNAARVTELAKALVGPRHGPGEPRASSSR
jgi:glycosyltransferase involved in cell wall biosynthesis